MVKQMSTNNNSTVNTNAELLQMIVWIDMFTEKNAVFGGELIIHFTYARKKGLVLSKTKILYRILLTLFNIRTILLTQIKYCF
jgi:hypothetical protein